MTKLVSIHQLHLAGATKGSVEVIEPGQVFTAREDELSLVRGGIHAAAREYDAETDKSLKVFARAGATATTDAPAAGSEDLTKLTKAQLIALAAAEEITIDDKATNAVIIEAIVAGRKAKDEDAI